MSQKDFMSTQTGGAGETIQAQTPNIQQESQFQANIRPVAEPQPQAEMPVTVEQQAPEVQASPELSLDLPTVEVSDEDRIYQQYGLNKVDIDIPEDIYNVSIPTDTLEQITPEAITTDDGFSVVDPKQFESYIAPAVVEDEIEEAPLIQKSDDGFDVYNGKGLIQEQNNKLSAEYKNTGIKVDANGAVKVVDPIKEYPVYKLPEGDDKYQKREDGWYKDINGKYVKIYKGNVAERSAYLDKNAVVVSSTLGKGSGAVSQSASTIAQRFGDPRRVEDPSIITAGGDAVVTDGLSFSALTKSNIGSKSQPLNPDGTKNFNYDPATEVKNPFLNNNPVNEKPDGLYTYPGNDSEYRKENGDWYIKPKGSKSFVSITKGNVPERIANLEKGAVKRNTILETLTVSPNIITDFSDKQKLVYNNPEFSNVDKSLLSLEEAKNFSSKNVDLLFRDNLSEDQKTELKNFQAKVSDVISDQKLSDTQKGIAVSDLMKRSQQYFESSKKINKEINTAVSEGVSLARVAYDHKKQIANAMLVEGGSPNSSFQSFTKEMFDASSDMADFFMENLDEGKIRFDSESNQYVISNMVSERERNFIESKLASYNEAYNKLQDERYVDINNEISRHKKNLANVDSNIGRLEETLRLMTKSGVPSDDPARADILKQLDKEKKKRGYIEDIVKDAQNTKSAVFLTEPKKVAANAAKNLSTDASTILSAIPKNISPKEQFDLFYKGLYEETARMMKDNEIGEDRFTGATMMLKDMLDWDGFFALTDVEKRVAKNIATLRSLSPLYFNNDTGITESSAGFFNSFMNSFAQALAPNVAKADGWRVQTDMAANNLEVITQELGMNPEDFVDEQFLDKLEKRSVNSEWNQEKWGGMTGSSMAIIIPLVATAGVGPGALRLASGIEKIAALGLGAKETTGIVNGAIRAYDAALDASRVGRFLKPAIESGLRFEIAGNVVQSAQDELYFLSGLAGGVASEALGVAFSKLPKEKALDFLSSVFGNQTGRAVNYIKKVGDLNAKGVAETGEEFAQELSNIYRDTDSFNGMMSELSNRFGSFDKVQEFVISSFILGAAFGVAENTSGKKAYERLPEEKRKQVDKALSEVTSAMNTAKKASNEYIENKNNQVEIDKKLREDDKKDESGVSGEVREGEKPVEGQPITEAGEETPSPSGVVQEEQGQTAEQVEERVTATSADEAKALWEQGYRPVVEGGQVRGGKDMAIDNLFNTKKEVEMVRMGTPGTQVEAETEPQVTPETQVEAETTAEAETEQKGFEKLAEKIRSGKIDTKGSSMISIVPPQVLNAALEGVALTVETVGQVIEKIKESDWYKSLNEYSKPIVEREISRSLNNLTSKTTYTEQDASNEAYATEFSDVYNRLLEQANQNPNAANINNLKAFTDNPKQFIQDLVDTGEIKSDVYYGVNIDASDKNKSTEDYISERMAKVDASISSDAKTNANNIIAKQQESKANTDAPFMMSDSISITSDIEKAKADGVTDEEIKEAQEYLDDPIKYHQEMYELFSDTNASYYDEERANKALRELNYVKSVYERYGVDTGLTPEQSQQIDQEAEKLPAAKKTTSKPRLTPEEKQARADQKKIEREKLKADREAKKKADKEFGKKVAEVTGTAKDEKTVQMTELQAIKEQLKNKSLGAKDLQKVKDQAKKFVVDNLPSGKDFEYTATDVKSAVRAVSMARNPESLEKAIEKVEALIDKKYQALDKKAEAKRKQTIKKIESLATSKKSTLSKRGNRWVGKVTTDAQKEFKDFVNSGALDNLDNKTQQELDAILDVMNGILGEGRADQKNKEAIENSLKRQRAAKLLEGLAADEDKVKLNSQEEIEEWLDKGNLVVINGELFRKSNLSELQNRRDAIQRRLDKKIAEAESAQELKDDAEYRNDIAEAELIDTEIRAAEAEAQQLQDALDSMPSAEGTSVTGYKQRPSSLVKEAQRQKAKSWYKSPSGILRALNPANAISDVYSLLKSAYSGSSEVAKFIKQNIERPIQKAYFNRLKGTSEKMRDLNNIRKEIFGSRGAAVSYLGSKPEVDVFTDRSARENFAATNGHFVDWYNLVRTNSNGMERMEKSGVDPQKLIDYVESTPELKAYADALLNKYNTDLRAEYEPVFEEYANQSFGENTYYPSYAADFRQEFVSESDVMGVEDMYNAMNATSRNFKERVNYAGPFDLRLDADAKYLDYVKSMEHAKHFLPIAKKANELFSKANSPYLVENMGVDNFNQLKQHLGVIVSDKPLEEYRGRFTKFLNSVRRFSTIAQLGFKISSIPKQFTSFTHYWVAGIDRGLDPVKIVTARPETVDEAMFAYDMLTSDYIKDRLKGGSLDVEAKAIAQQAQQGNISKAWLIASEIGMSFTKGGDISVVIGPGGGLQFALAMYKKNLASGMSKEDAYNDAYEAFVTETERAQQSSREDITSMMQRDPNFRTMVQYRTGQMAVTKKIVNGVKNLNQAYKIQNEEGVEARREAISDREIIQSITDILYYGTVGNVFFSAVAGGALYYGLKSDDEDETKRMKYDIAMDQIQSLAQGMGWGGFVVDRLISSMRSDDWKNNIPVLSFISKVEKTLPTLYDANERTWFSATEEKRREYEKTGTMEVPLPWDEFEQFRKEYEKAFLWTKMTESEKKKITNAIGGNNIVTFINNMGKYFNEEKDLIPAIMNYDDNYFEKAKESRKKDRIFEFLYGEPYIPQKGGKKIIGAEPFPEEIDSPINDEIKERLR